jgi:hypothetical protein
MIGELGYRVSSNTNPDAVIEEIKHGTFQIVIADVSPPRTARSTCSRACARPTRTCA